MATQDTTNNLHKLFPPLAHSLLFKEVILLLPFFSANPAINRQNAILFDAYSSYYLFDSSLRTTNVHV